MMPLSCNVHTLPFLYALFEAPDIDAMAAWDLVHAWRRSLAFLARGLYTCSLVALYLFISLVLCSGYRTARTAPSPSHPQASLGKEPAGSLPSLVAEDKSSAISETASIDFDAPFNDHRPRFVTGQPLVPSSEENARTLVIPKIVVQDFSSEDGPVWYKTPEYDPTHSLKRRRRPSRVRASAFFEDHLAATGQPSFRLPPTLGAPFVGGLRTLHSADGLKHRRSDVFVQKLLGFPGRKQVLGDVVAKDGSFVIVGL